MKKSLTHRHFSRIADELMGRIAGANSAISVQNPECVEKSYPDFWRDLENCQKSTGVL